MKDKVRPLYLQLMGILSQTPSYDSAHTTISSHEIWENYNNMVDRLNTIIGEDYNSFKITPKAENWNGSVQYVVNGTLFRQQLNGLINYLHGQYYNNERPPFSGEATAVFQQNQVVSQTTDVQVLMMTVLEVQEKLIKKEGEYPSDTPENNFIQTLKEALRSVRSNVDLINLILQTALATGLTLGKLKDIFS